MSHPKTTIDSKNNKISFWLKSDVYPIESIYGTAYVFLDRVYVYLDGDPKKEVEVHLKGKEKLGAGELKSLQGEFLNELLNFLLRVEVTRNNQKIREYIVASALLSSLPGELLNQTTFTEVEMEEDMSWKDDPLGIAVPWEEKGKKEAKKGQKKRKK